MFACFGLMGMNSAYSRFYNIQVPYMEHAIEERNKKKTKKGEAKCLNTETKSLET